MSANLTARQQHLVNAIRACLARHSAAFDEGAEPVAEPIHVFDIRTTDPRLRVRILILDDAFHIEADEALLVRDLAAYPQGGDEAWTADCVSVLDKLLSEDLRIRVRKPLLFSPTGAIWVPAGAGESGWSGEEGAVRGKGTEAVFPGWYLTVGARESR